MGLDGSVISGMELTAEEMNGKRCGKFGDGKQSAEGGATYSK
jgi:hypothetical protein